MGAPATSSFPACCIQYLVFGCALAVCSVNRPDDDTTVERHPLLIHNRPCTLFFTAELQQLMVECWAQEAEDRPTMADIVDYLREVQEHYPDDTA